MLDIAGQSGFDKERVAGGCVRLALAVDLPRLQAEVDALPAQLWGSRGGRVGVHRVAEAVFLRGHAPAEGELPVADREPLARLPSVREFIERTVPAAPMRVLLARLPAGAVIAPHIDRAPYFAKTVRIHVPIVTHAQVHMFCAGAAYTLAAGEVWSLNNVAVHAVWNEHASAPRTHLIADFLPSPGLLALLRGGERGLGRDDAALQQRFAARLAQQQSEALPAA